MPSLLKHSSSPLRTILRQAQDDRLSINIYKIPETAKLKPTELRLPRFDHAIGQVRIRRL